MDRNVRMQEIERLLQTSAERLRLANEVGAYDQVAQEESYRQGLLEELSRLQNEVAEEARNTENNTNTNDDLFEGVMADGMPTAEQQFENATGIPFNPNEHEIVYDGAADLGDGVGTPFRVVRRELTDTPADRTIDETQIPDNPEYRTVRANEEFLERETDADAFERVMGIPYDPARYRVVRNDDAYDDGYDNPISTFDIEEITNNRQRDNEPVGPTGNNDGNSTNTDQGGNTGNDDNTASLNQDNTNDQIVGGTPGTTQDDNNQDVQEQTQTQNPLQDLSDNDLANRLQDLWERVIATGDQASPEEQAEFDALIGEQNRRRQEPVVEVTQEAQETNNLGNLSDDELNNRLQDLWERVGNAGDQASQEEQAEFDALIGEQNRRKQEKETTDTPETNPFEGLSDEDLDNRIKDLWERVVAAGDGASKEEQDEFDALVGEQNRRKKEKEATNKYAGMSDEDLGNRIKDLWERVVAAGDGASKEEQDEFEALLNEQKRRKDEKDKKNTESTSATPVGGTGTDTKEEDKKEETETSKDVKEPEKAEDENLSPEDKKIKELKEKRKELANKYFEELNKSEDANVTNIDLLEQIMKVERDLKKTLNQKYSNTGNSEEEPVVENKEEEKKTEEPTPREKEETKAEEVEEEKETTKKRRPKFKKFVKYVLDKAKAAFMKIKLGISHLFGKAGLESALMDANLASSEEEPVAEEPVAEEVDEVEAKEPTVAPKVEETPADEAAIEVPDEVIKNDTVEPTVGDEPVFDAATGKFQIAGEEFDVRKKQAEELEARKKADEEKLKEFEAKLQEMERIKGQIDAEVEALKNGESLGDGESTKSM